MSVTQTAIRRPVTVGMFFVAVALFGYVSLERLPLNLLPDISYPSLTVQTDYEDAAPEEIESLLTRPIEEAAGVSSGLTRISSVSRAGQSEVVLEFAWGTNMDLASLDVREKLDLVQVPRDAERPVILRFDPSFDPILRMQLSASTSLARLRTIAEEELKKQLEAVEGVAAVKVAGGREEQIRIEIDEKRLAELGIPITEVTNILRQENLNQASGALYDFDASYLIRMLNEFRTVEEIQGIIVRNQDGRQVVLGDVAEVWRGVKDRGVITRFGGHESVELAIYKEGDANTVTVARGLEQRLEQIKKSKNYPKETEVAIVFNQADFISESVDNVLDAALIGGALAIVILFVFLRDARSTLIIGLSIPISIMATFAAMYQTGISLNIMSLGGVALGVGMLVDNSIVVLEAVHRRRQKSPAEPLATAVWEGTSEVATAVTASTLTTVAVFLPLVFVEGVAGQLFTDQALTITYSLLASLGVSLTFIPMLLALEVSHLEETSADGEPPTKSEAAPVGVSAVIAEVKRFTRFLFHDVVRTVVGDVRRILRALGRGFMWLASYPLDWFDRVFGSLNDGYPRVLRASLENKGVVLAIVVLASALAWVSAQGLGGELIPPMTQGEFSFEVKTPEGTRIERTAAIVREIESLVLEYPEVENVSSSVGGSQQNQFAAGAVEENYGQIHVALADRTDKVAEEQVISRIRRELARFPETVHTFSRPTLFSFKTPVEVEIFSFDLAEQRRAAEMIAARLAQIEGLEDVQTTTRLGNPEIQIRFDRARLARLGLEENRVAQVLRNKIRGDVASRYREGDRQIDILVRASEGDRSALSSIAELIVNSPRSERENEGAENGQAAGQGQGQGQGQAQSQNQSPFGGSTNPGGQQQSGTSRASAPIRLGQIADITIARGPSEIRRIRSQRAALVSASLVGRDLNSVAGDIRAALAELRPELPVNVSAGLGGQNEELEVSYNSLMFALGLAIFLVYLVMASQFESLVHPFVILFTVPLALIGVAFALFLSGIAVSVIVLLGVIILAGIVVNNAIVLIDYANQLRAEGRTRREALIEAGQVRLRPILMTTLTTLLGLAPMALGWGEGAELRAPMAVAVIGGLSFATLLTLVLIPVVYEWADRRVLVGDRIAAGSGDEQAWQGAD